MLGSSSSNSVIVVVVVVIVVINSAYYLWMATPSIDIPAIHGWNMPLV